MKKEEWELLVYWLDQQMLWWLFIMTILITLFPVIDYGCDYYYIDYFEWLTWDLNHSLWNHKYLLNYNHHKHSITITPPDQSNFLSSSLTASYQTISYHIISYHTSINKTIFHQELSTRRRRRSSLTNSLNLIENYTYQGAQKAP